TESAAKVSGVNQGGARGIELRHEGVGALAHATAVKATGPANPLLDAGLKGPCSGWKIGRAGSARDVGVAVGVHCDARSITAVAKIGGVDERGASRIEFHHEGMPITVVGRLEGPQGRRESGA